MADSLIQLPAPPYLYHGLGGASFCPLSLLTFLPTSAGEFLDPSHPAAHVHEQAHYFQVGQTQALAGQQVGDVREDPAPATRTPRVTGELREHGVQC